MTDPNRYNNLYTYIMEATKRDENCWNLKHNFDDSKCYDSDWDTYSCAYFGNPETVIPNTSETVCRDPNAPKPPKEWPLTAFTAKKDDDNYLYMQNNVVSGKILGAAVHFTIMRQVDSDKLGNDSYFSTLAARLEEGHAFNGQTGHTGAFVAYRFYWYPNGATSDENHEPYLNFMYPTNVEYFSSAAAVNFDSVTFNKSVSKLIIE